MIQAADKVGTCTAHPLLPICPSWLSKKQLWLLGRAYCARACPCVAPTAPQQRKRDKRPLRKSHPPPVLRLFHACIIASAALLVFCFGGSQLTTVKTNREWVAVTPKEEELHASRRKRKGGQARSIYIHQNINE